MLYIFDYDGVLRSLSFEGVYQGYRAIVRQILEKNPEDFWADIEEFKEWFDVFWPNNLKRLGIGFNEKLDDIFREQYARHTHIFPWADAILKVISRNNQLSICSTAPSSKIRQEMGKLAEFFSLIVGANDVKNIKPDPEGIHIILEQTGCPPENAIIIGDAETDILAGKAAGIQTGAVNWGLSYWRDDEWEKIITLKPDYIFSCARDLIFVKRYASIKEDDQLVLADEEP